MSPPSSPCHPPWTFLLNTDVSVSVGCGNSLQCVYWQYLKENVWWFSVIKEERKVRGSKNIRSERNRHRIRTIHGDQEVLQKGGKFINWKGNEKLGTAYFPSILPWQKFLNQYNEFNMKKFSKKDVDALN